MPPYSTRLPDAVMRPESCPGKGNHAPEISTPAGWPAGPEKSSPCPKHRVATKTTPILIRLLLSRRARLRIPAAVVDHALVVRRRHVRLRQIGGIFYGARDHQVSIAIRFVHAIDKFRERRVRAVRDSVLAQISGFEIRR